MLKRPSFFIALLGIVAIVVLVTRLRKPDPTPVPLAEPAKTPYTQSIGGRGIVESRDENVRIAPTVGGRIDRIFVKVGDVVKKGDPLFQVDARDSEAELLLQERQLQVLETRVKQNQVTVDDKAAMVGRSKNLLEKKAGSEDVAERDRYALEAARSALVSAKADYELGQAQVNRARVALDLKTVRAPRDGTILQVAIREGEYAMAGSDSTLMIVGDIAQLQLRADVDEDSASKIKPGAPAVAFIKGMQSDEIPLRFVRIDPYILPKQSLTGESTERVDTRVLQVIYQFDNPKFPVYVGQQMDVFIEDTDGEGKAGEDKQVSR